KKLSLTAPGVSAGLNFFSALKSRYLKGLAVIRASRDQNSLSLRQDFAERDCAPELHGLLGSLASVRQKILTNSFLGDTAGLLKWVLIALIVAGALSARWNAWLVVGAAFAILGLVFLLFWTVRTRLSTYETASQLDLAAGLKDRLSTA